MRLISADYIFPISSAPIPNGIVAIDDDGEIIDIYTSASAIPHELEVSIECYKGIICPGFVNTHCHLELSHLKGIITEGGGLPAFIKEIIVKRSLVTDEEGIAQAIRNAELEMIKNGIVAVGDISNTADTLPQKIKGNLIYYNFIELFDLYNADKTESFFAAGKQLEQQFIEAQQQLPLANTSLVPHASYSVSPNLFNQLTASSNNKVLSIHNQETPSEDELFISKSGALLQTLKDMGVIMDLFKPTGTTALRSTLPYSIKCKNLLLVHNTYTTSENISWAIAYHKQSNYNTRLFWVTCPNANLYIENKLPDYKAFIASNATLTVGTDSYASNWSLSLLDELKTISKHYPDIDLHTLLSWSTKNGADALDLSDQLGTLEKGKKPGLNLITTSNNLQLTPNSTVTKLL